MALHVVMYHYVRDLPRSPYPRLKAMLLDDFRRQVAALGARYEMATLASALDYLEGRYRPARDLCLLTFDDGLKEHYREVTPLLEEAGVQGLFFVITGCPEEHSVASVHMNHLLMASMEFEEYHRRFLEALGERPPAADPAVAASTYPWDTPEVAAFKYFFNFTLDGRLRDAIVRRLFTESIGPEAACSRELYMSWDDARAMQKAGMVLGGHSHEHRPLSAMRPECLAADLAACRRLLDARLLEQPAWPFCFPYGKKDSFNRNAVEQLNALGFRCAFTTETGANEPGADPFAIRRIDCKNAL